jgi:protein gp37
VKGGIAKLRKIHRNGQDFMAEHGHWPCVFCSSLSDVFDNAVSPDWRRESFQAIEAATDTRILLLTKRIGNVFKMVPAAWLQDGWPAHVGLMITVVNQEEANRDTPKLLDLKARFGIPWVGLSVEPMLGPVFLNLLSLGPGQYPGQRVVGDTYDALIGEKVVGTKTGYERIPNGATIDWVIVGGESGHNARPSNPQWFRDLRDQCATANVPFLFKQWGEWVSVSEVEGPGDHHSFEDGRTVRKVGKARAGRLLDGREWTQFPDALQTT